MNFDSLGYSSVFFLYNMGTLTIGLASIPLLMVLALIIQILTKVSVRLVRIKQKLSTYVFWNYVILVLFESYSVMCACAFINLKSVSLILLTFLAFVLIDWSDPQQLHNAILPSR